MVVTNFELYAEVKQWGWDENPHAFTVERNVVWQDGAYYLAELAKEENIALGKAAKDDFGLRVPLTDGKIDLIVSEWISNSPNVFGRNFIVDLGQNRAITKVRVIPGQTALNQPEYFVRGYRIEAAHENSRDVWRLLAERPTHFNLILDTQVDSSWSVIDEDGVDSFREARYVRLTITRQDRSNWVAIGDIEVFGTGFHSDGDLEFQFEAQQPVNVGRISWDTDLPDKTTLRLRAKSVSSEIQDWSETASIREGVQYSGVEPVKGVNIRADLSSNAAFSTPILKSLKIDYDPILVASSVLCHTRPNQVERKKIVEVEYFIEAMIGVEDHGIDFVELNGSVFEDIKVDINGQVLTTSEYEVSSNPDLNTVRIELLSTIRRDSRITITGETRLFVDTRLRAAVGSRLQAERDKYLNWQHGIENPLESWDLQVVGLPGDLLSSIEQSSSVVTPGSSDASFVSFDFDVDNISSSAEISIEFYSMNGILVNRMSEFGNAGAYRFKWDGRSENKEIVPPGLYMYQISVEGGGEAGLRRGTCVVAY